MINLIFPADSLIMFKKKLLPVCIAFIFWILVFACTTNSEYTVKDELDGQYVKAEAKPSFGSAPLTVSFNSAGTWISQGNDLSFLWDFDNSSVSTESFPEHTYNAMGTYMVSLTVTRPDRSKDTAWVIVIVN